MAGSTSTSTSTAGPSPCPHFHLLCMNTNFSDAFLKAAGSPGPPSTSASKNIQVPNAVPQSGAAAGAGTVDEQNPFTPGLPDTFSYTIHNNYMSALPASVQFDLIVSPANSYGLLDGGFDDAITRVFSPKGEYYALTRYVQRRLWDRWRGYLPVGHTEIVRLPGVWSGFEGEDSEEILNAIGEASGSGGGDGIGSTTAHSSGLTKHPSDGSSIMPGSWSEVAERRNKNVWQCRYIAMCPTMRVPALATGDREVVYECTWTLLCAIDRHNRRVRELNNARKASTPGSSLPQPDTRVSEHEIKSILITPLGTGVGRIPAQRWAQQTVLAIRHFYQAQTSGSAWNALEWDSVQNIDEEIEGTWDEDEV